MNHKRLIFVVCIVLLLALVTTGLALAAEPSLPQVAGNWSTGILDVPTPDGSWNIGMG